MVLLRGCVRGMVSGKSSRPVGKQTLEGVCVGNVLIAALQYVLSPCAQLHNWHSGRVGWMHQCPETLQVSALTLYSVDVPGLQMAAR
jgi:hypothetical protein